MTKILEITATTTDAEIEAAIPFLDMQGWAKDNRDILSGIYRVSGKQAPGLELFEIGGVTVLWCSAWCYGLVNRWSPGTGNSIRVSQVPSPEEAVELWRSED